MTVIVTVNYIIQSDPAVSAVFNPAAGPFSAPLPAGTLVGTITVTPSDWSGNFGPSGSQAGDVAIVPSGTAGVFNVLTVGVQAAGSYSVPEALTP